MDATLVKTENGYALEDCAIIAFVSSVRPEHKHFKLSLSNCQAIELGYDLEELAKIEYPICEVWNDKEALIRKLAFKKGFQKALEILGDRKFTEEDMKKYALYVESRRRSTVSHIGCINNGNYMNEFQHIQQNKWDVVVEMEGPLIYPANLPKEGEERPAYRFKLDENGCLILKRKP